ncbi:MAG: hypothetical protein AAB706_02135 [Patescibacteria group bacterium]
MEMVSYWKKGESVAAKVMKAEDGSLVMKLEGEKYPFPTFPRGHLLFGALSPLKHQIKNQIFNESWAKKENWGVQEIQEVKRKLLSVNEIPKWFEPLKYDIIPLKNMTPSVREIYRGWTKTAPEHTFVLRDYLCFILQEDDGYRMRVQWLVGWFGFFFKWKPIKSFELGLKLLEHAEVIGDMKEKILLLRTILMLCLKDENIKKHFIAFAREVDWKKVKLTRADKYHFRGKYFKVDYPYLEY